MRTVPAIIARALPIWALITRTAQMLSGLLPEARDPRSIRHLGACAVCGHPVYADEAFLRYLGDYYHASGCLERDPPALRRAARPS